MEEGQPRRLTGQAWRSDRWEIIAFPIDLHTTPQGGTGKHGTRLKLKMETKLDNVSGRVVHLAVQGHRLVVVFSRPRGRVVQK
jgi:hypothetical protein